MKLKLIASKKGQFYVLIALILISYAFLLAREDVPLRKPNDNFRLLHEGYMAEGVMVINSAVYEEANVSARLSAFTDDYVAFARSTEPGFRMVYLLNDGSRLAVGNRLDDSVNVTVASTSYSIPSNSGRTVPLGDASLAVSGLAYSFRFSSDVIQLKAIFRASDKLTKRVFVEG